MKLLYISYFFPPLGGPAAIRNQKTVKYLGDFGWDIDVLTVGEIEYNYHDESLLASINPDKIFRVPSLDPMALLKKIGKHKDKLSTQVYHSTPESIKQIIRRLAPLDDKVFWLPNLLQKAKKMMGETSYELIYVSCGPFSSALAAKWLSKRFGVPYVLEMRDYWTLLKDYNIVGFGLNRLLARATEKSCIKKASLLVAATQGIASDLAESFDPSLPERSFVLFNGHDEADFNGLKAADRQTSGFVLSYFGALYAKRSLKCLLKALSSLEKQKLLPAGFELRLYGSFHRESVLEIEQSGIGTMVRIVPQLQHRQALEHMLASDALLLLINSDSPKGTLTSKIFEYLRCGKPILALAPQHGEAAELLKESGQTYLCPMESSTLIMKSLQDLLKDHDKAREYHYPAQKYERRTQIEFLSNRMLEKLR